MSLCSREFISEFSIPSWGIAKSETVTLIVIDIDKSASKKSFWIILLSTVYTNSYFQTGKFNKFQRSENIVSVIFWLGKRSVEHTLSLGSISDFDWFNGETSLWF